MGQTLAELESQGLVSRRPDAADGRRTLLELTDAGRQTLAEDRGRREGWLAQAIEQGFSADEQEVLAQAIPLLARLTEL
jgi:DNA-binding MarR family transcriptional regulator